jgi:hypothetical protein
MANIDLASVSQVFTKFVRTDLGGTLATIEGAVGGLTATTCAEALADAGVRAEVFSAAAVGLNGATSPQAVSSIRLIYR